jgi:hypothetical protein
VVSPAGMLGSRTELKMADLLFSFAPRRGFWPERIDAPESGLVCLQPSRPLEAAFPPAAWQS